MTPHQRELLADTLTPLAVAERLGQLSSERFLFESVTGGEHVSRYSFLGSRPREIVAVWPDRLERWSGDRNTPQRLPGAPLEALANLTAGYQAPGHGLLPFTGGWVGYFGYDLVRLVERLPSRHGAAAEPVVLLARFDEVVAFDHARQRLVVVANEIEGEVSAAQAEARLDELVAVLTAPAPTWALALPAQAPPRELPIAEDFDGPAFELAVETAKEHIRAGDIFQVVLARRFGVETTSSPLAIYRALRLINPSPYMVLLELPKIALVGASPEMLVRVTGRLAETRPIAGTRPRGRTAPPMPRWRPSCSPTPRNAQNT